MVVTSNSYNTYVYLHLVDTYKIFYTFWTFNIASSLPLFVNSSQNKLFCTCFNISHTLIKYEPLSKVWQRPYIFSCPHLE